MENELNPQIGTESSDSPELATTNAPRDIIAERMAARMKQNESRPPRVPEPKIEQAEPIEMEAIEAIDALELPFEKVEATSEKTALPPLEIKKLNAILAEATAELQTSAPEPVEKRERPERQPRDRNRRERGPRDRQRTDSTMATPEVEAKPEPIMELKPRAPGKTAAAPDRPRQQRNERPQKSVSTPERPRDQKPINKSTENSYQRAHAYASRVGVSVVVPLYNEQDSLRELTAAIREELFKLCEKKYEIIFINDGSTDRSAQILKDLSATSSRISVITFRSNLGKSAALSVGFSEAEHGIIITMDADLQDDPKEFVNLIAKLDEGFDLVTGWKKKRNDPIGKTLPSKLFNSVTSFFSGLSLHDFNCGLKAYRKAVTDSLDVYGEMHRYLPALAHWQGFKVAEVPVLHHPRKFGKSKFGTSRFFKGFLDLLTILFTNRYSRRPLHLFGTVGTLLALLGLGINVFVSIEWLRGLTTLSNRPILWLGILLILVGVQLISIGLLGEMMVKNAAKSSQIPYDKERRKPRPKPTNDRRNPA